MSSEYEHEFAPIRSDNILTSTTSHTASTFTSSTTDGDRRERPFTGSTAGGEVLDHGHREESIERPTLRVEASSTDVEDDYDLKKIHTTQSIRDRRSFQPIRSGDREELQRIASNFGGSVARTRTHDSGLSRQDTLAGVNIGDPVLDPKSPEFDIYKWSRM